MIKVKEAIERILKEIRVLGLERVGILDAYGRVLGEDIYAPWDLPPWDNSAMDGYAVRSEDLSDGSEVYHPKSLKVVGNLPAGCMAKEEIKTGEAIKIMTGASLPEGADTVVMVENTEVEGDEVKVLKRVEMGKNVRKKGEDIKTGELIIRKGIPIRPSEVGMMAAMGKSSLLAYQRPKVAVMSTGDELVKVDKGLEDGKIIDSNSYTLASQIISVGATPLHLGIAKDKKGDIKAKIEKALSADVIISSGGVSVGEYDFVKDVLREIGAEMKFWKVAIKPGKPLAFGMILDKPFFGLPGNPVSSMVAFEEFVRPALLKMMGRKDIFRKTLEASLTEDVLKKPGRTNFIQSHLKHKESGLSVTPVKIRGSGILSSMVRANSFVVLPEESTGAKAGEMVKVQLLDDRGQEEPGL